MTIEPKHNISDELLMSYAAGALSQAFDIVVASHVSLSPDSRVRLDGFESIGGAVLDEMDAADLAEDSLDRALARIEGVEPEPREIRLRSDAVLPEPVQKLVGGDIDAIEWRGIGMGVKQAVLHDDDHGTARLLYIPAGGEMPRHTHRGLEMTLVLQGAYSDEDGRYGRGDIEVAGQETHHSPTAEAGEACICLIATDARLKFDGLLPRIAQPFIGI
ncbi:transcriptional regulator [Rhodobacterales bacterium HKCCE3408]|nr:transcriptional regulator [Rhodobacterales bacterium HKCCE3408]